MFQTTLYYLRRRGKALGSSLMILSLAGTSFLFTSCTTEEGLIAGGLAGAAVGGLVGGLVGHSQERSYKRNRPTYANATPTTEVAATVVVMQTTTAFRGRPL